MKKQKRKLSIKVRDLEPLKNVTGGRHRHHRLQSRTYHVPLGVEPFGCRKMGLLMLWNKHGAAPVVLDK